MQEARWMSANRRVLYGRTILIVEDEPLIALEVHAAFRAAGASIEAAAHSSEALEMINSSDLSAAVVVIVLGRGEDCSAVC
jgi:DNA-binding response OmpR family regulator